ncbi:uncharacterized protein LOC122279481 [Carya illinoinensis]|uniref:uncharacterized protein LOC122279481 n=1 Tax=Carya illinoinensis TaxID=32201 RepID=UPI001C718D44|nr:uncharacterized protein LOC122279481 [Carya illinoinensis]
MYADDIFIFANGGKRTMKGLMEALYKYEAWTGQVLNKEKSPIFFSKRILVPRKHSLLYFTGFTDGSFPFKYLGVPIVDGRLKACDFGELLGKLTNKIAGWKMKILSVSSRTILLRHVLSSMATHLLVVLDVPKVVILSLNKLLSSFFWGDSRGKYVKGNRLSLLEPTKGTHLWKSIVRSISKVINSSKWIVKEGNIFFCLVGHQKAKDLYDFLASRKEGQDVLVWLKDKEDNFTTKSAWDCIRVRTPPLPRPQWIWNTNLPKKISLIMWKAVNNCLSVDENVKMVGVPMGSKYWIFQSCPLSLRGFGWLDGIGLNRDGSNSILMVAVSRNLGIFGVGGVIRDDNGKLLLAYSVPLGLGTNNFAEIGSLLEGVRRCHALGFYRVQIETNSQLVINWITKDSCPIWYLEDFWDELQDYLNSLEYTVNHIYREGNVVADFLAKCGVEGLNSYWSDIHTLPSPLRGWLLLVVFLLVLSVVGFSG